MCVLSEGKELKGWLQEILGVCFWVVLVNFLSEGERAQRRRERRGRRGGEGFAATDGRENHILLMGASVNFQI